MRRFLVVLISGVAAVVLSSCLWAQDFKFERQQMKDRQKAEWKALRLKHKYAKESMKGQEVPKSIRIQTKHQLQREARELRQRHADERQDLKDRQRAIQEMPSGS